MDDTYVRIIDGIEERARKTGISPRLLAMLSALESDVGDTALLEITVKPDLVPVLSPMTLDALCASLGCDTNRVAAINCMDGAAWLMPGSFITVPARL